MSPRLGLTPRSLAGHLLLLAAGVAAPFLFPGHTIQFAVFWVFVLFALTWDIMGGQMGYTQIFVFGAYGSSLLIVQ